MYVIALNKTLQFSADQMNKPGPYRTLQTGPAYSSGLAQTVRLLIFYITTFVILDPPQNLTMSIDEIEANEDDQIDEIQCSAEGSPTPSYYWTFNNEVVAEGEVLVFSDPVKR